MDEMFIWCWSGATWVHWSRTWKIRRGSVKKKVNLTSYFSNHLQWISHIGAPRATCTPLLSGTVVSATTKQVVFRCIAGAFVVNVSMSVDLLFYTDVGHTVVGSVIPMTMLITMLVKLNTRVMLKMQSAQWVVITTLTAASALQPCLLPRRLPVITQWLWSRLVVDNNTGTSMVTVKHCCLQLRQHC